MNAPNLIKLGPAADIQTLSAVGRTFRWGYEEGLYREARAASMLLRRDWKAQKKIFTLEYEAVDSVLAARIEALFALKSALTLQVQEGATLVSYTVQMSPFELERLRLGLWTNVVLTLRQV